MIMREDREVDERRRAGPRPPGGLAAVGDEVIAQLAVGALDRRVDLVVRRLEAAVGHDQLEVLDQALHAVVGRPLVGQRELLGDRHVDRARRAVLDRLRDESGDSGASLPCGRWKRAQQSPSVA